MANFSFRRRAFLNPASTDSNSYVHAVVESSHDGSYQWGTNMITLADCRRSIELEFAIGNKRLRRISLAKINLLIKILTAFRDALVKEIEAIERAK